MAKFGRKYSDQNNRAARPVIEDRISGDQHVRSQSGNDYGAGAANRDAFADGRRIDADGHGAYEGQRIDRDRDGVVDGTLREEVVRRERAEFGGMKFGTAFFGWLTAMGTALLLTALIAGTGTAIQLANPTTADDVTEGAVENATTIGIIGAIVLALVIFVAYFSGGYVAGRMARFDGAKQGIAVWLWALVIAIVVATIGAIGGAQFNVLANLNGFPRIPVNEGDVTTAGIITAVVLAVVSLAGAVLGGMSGMRYHRRVDRVGLGA